MTTVYVEDGEPIDHALRRFKKECQKSGIPSELRRREHYEKPSVTKKRKLEAAKFVREYGDQVCPAGWQPGDETLKPGLDLVGKI